MTFSFPKEFVLFDLEYTAWEESQSRDWSGPDEHREIIQIGALRVAGTDLLEVDSFLEYVRPVIHPTLSKFITDLTGITQNDIEMKGVSYHDAFAKFLKFVADSSAFCWGRDIQVFEENSALSNIPFALSTQQFKNLRPLMADEFLNKGVDIEQYTSGSLIEGFGKDRLRRPHDALNDVRNLLDAFKELRKY